MTIKSLINDIVKACIALYMEHDYEYVLDLKRSGHEATRLDIEQEVEFIKRNNLAHEALSDKAITKAAKKVFDEMSAIEANMDAMIEVERVLDRQLTDCGHKLLKEDWKAFYTEPNKYAGTVVVDMILDYLRNIK